WSFSEGRARVVECQDECRLAYIDKEARVIVSFESEAHGEDFKDDLAVVSIGDSATFYIDKNGKTIRMTKYGTASAP
ncbi:MAG: hypothetical protein WCF57_05375, partial [Pyrinomonadaceae bacterium]